MQLGDGWNECLGGIPKVGVVAIWGHSGNGKSGAAMSLCKECGAYGKVLYVASEEGFGASLRTLSDAMTWHRSIPSSRSASTVMKN